MSLEEWQQLGYDEHSNIAPDEDKLFTNYLSGEYTLLEESMAVDNGTDLVSQIVTQDLDDVPRPQGNGFDIGAYEYLGPSGLKGSNILTGFILYQNYPNPFNPVTKIRYKLGSRQFVLLKVFDLFGRETATLVNEQEPAGEYEIEFNASGLASGIYFYKIQAGNYFSAKKLILLK
jgi:hypothetical protein